MAISMGANIGISKFIYIGSLLLGFRDSPIVSISGAVFLLIQQCIIMISFSHTQKVSQLCKKVF